MNKQYFYSDDLSECAGCGGSVHLTQGFGALQLTAPNQPTIFYCVCTACEEKLFRQEFQRQVKDNVVARARELGAFGLSEAGQ